MRENNEDWSKQRNSVVIEIKGLSRIFLQELEYLVLLSKLEGLDDSIDFIDYRKAIFESITLLNDLWLIQN